MKTPDSIKKFADIFARLPGIGPRQAIRLAFYFIYKGGGLTTETIHALELIQKIRICKQCFFIHENSDGLCDICRDPKRNKAVIAIVEKETDLISLENTGKFNGRYLVLGDLRKKGILESDQKIKIDSLKAFINNLENKKAEEILIAINPTSIGILNAKLIAEDLKPFTNKITKLGIGIPSGGEIEFADEDTLGEALERRS